MITKEQHIKYWVDTAERDWIAAENMFMTKDYMHSLFWAHLVLEKLAKAHWVKNSENDVPPKIHNIVRLLKQSNVDLEDETMFFLEKFNDFQQMSRYPDFHHEIFDRCTKEYTYKQLEKVKEVRECLIKMLQSE